MHGPVSQTNRCPLQTPKLHSETQSCSHVRPGLCAGDPRRASGRPTFKSCEAWGSPGVALLGRGACPAGSLGSLPDDDTAVKVGKES